MAKRLQHTLITGLLSSSTVNYKANWILLRLRPFSTIQKMGERCDLFEYTSGRWMYVANQHSEHVELLD